MRDLYFLRTALSTLQQLRVVSWLCFERHFHSGSILLCCNIPSVPAREIASSYLLQNVKFFFWQFVVLRMFGFKTHLWF